MWWKWVLDTLGRFNVEKIWDEVIGESGFVRKNWSTLLIGAGTMIGAISEHWSWTGAFLAVLAAVSLAIFVRNQIALAKNDQKGNAAVSVALPSEQREKPTHCGLAKTTARWLYLRAMNAKVDASWKKLELLRPMIEDILKNPPVHGYGASPERVDLMRDWALELKALDYIFREWSKSHSDLAKSAYTPNRQPIPLNLSSDDQLTYRKFYDQVLAWETEGVQYRSMMEREEQVARESAFDDARRVKFQAG